MQNVAERVGVVKGEGATGEGYRNESFKVEIKEMGQVTMSVNSGASAVRNTLMLQGKAGPRCYLTSIFLEALEKGDYEGGGMGVGPKRPLR